MEQVEHLPMESQEKLMKAFSSKCINRTGNSRVIPLDTRVIASSETDLSEAVENGSFREDLRRYLSAFDIPLPPLRERKEDIPVLIEQFIKIENSRARIPIKTIRKDVVRFLTQYSWPGNLRELENCVATMVFFASKETLTMEDIPLDILVKQVDSAKTGENVRLPLKSARHRFERQYIRRVLEKTRGNQTRAATLLGLHRNTLIWKLRELGLEDDCKRIVKKRRESRGRFNELEK